MKPECLSKVCNPLRMRIGWDTGTIRYVNFCNAERDRGLGTYSMMSRKWFLKADALGPGKFLRGSSKGAIKSMLMSHTTTLANKSKSTTRLALTSSRTMVLKLYGNIMIYGKYCWTSSKERTPAVRGMWWGKRREANRRVQLERPINPFRVSMFVGLSYLPRSTWIKGSSKSGLRFVFRLETSLSQEEWLRVYFIYLRTLYPNPDPYPVTEFAM